MGTTWQILQYYKYIYRYMHISVIFSEAGLRSEFVTVELKFEIDI